MRAASRHIHVEIFGVALQHPVQVVAAGNSYKNPGLCLGQSLRRLARILKSFPHDLQQQALLRIHAKRQRKRGRTGQHPLENRRTAS